MAPELVSITAGGNDLLRPGADPDRLAVVFDGAVAQLRAVGSEVLMFTGFDPRTFPILRWIRGRVAIYNMHLRAIADRHGCALVDLWSMPVLCDRRAWSDDRLHLTAEGHRRVALRACEAVGVPPGGDWREPLPMLAAVPRLAVAGWLAARQVDARWARRYAAPWVQRRLRGASSGDGLQPKRAELLPLDVPAWPPWPKEADCWPPAARRFRPCSPRSAAQDPAPRPPGPIRLAANLLPIMTSRPEQAGRARQAGDGRPARLPGTAGGQYRSCWSGRSWPCSTRRSSTSRCPPSGQSCTRRPPAWSG